MQANPPLISRSAVSLANEHGYVFVIRSDGRRDVTTDEAGALTLIRHEYTDLTAKQFVAGETVSDSIEYSPECVIIRVQVKEG